jgi:hypothetical protein
VGDESERDPEDLTDDQPAAPSKQPVPANEARRNISEPSELDDDLIDPKGQPDASTLAKLLTFHPFMRFFCFLADRQSPGSHLPQTRVRRLREEDKKLYWACVIGDFVVTAASAVVIIAAAAVVLYKTVWLGMPEQTNQK